MIVSTFSAQNSGKGTAMFSRAGKSTINQYKCFNDKTKELKVANREDDDCEVLWDTKEARNDSILAVPEPEINLAKAGKELSLAFEEDESPVLNTLNFSIIS
jgi:hypothetical protein